MNTFLHLTKDQHVEFIKTDVLPPEHPVIASFVLPYLGTKVVLTHTKEGRFFPVGHVCRDSETYLETLSNVRLTEDCLSLHEQLTKLIGYIKVESQKGVIAVATSFIESFKDKRLSPITTSLGLFKPEDALLETRNNKDHLMVVILETVIEYYKDQNYQPLFLYKPNEMFPDVPVTPVFTFCRNEVGNFCIVRDGGENFFSLPGGGCEIGECPTKCLQRELMEEAQLTCKNIRLLGSILVELMKEEVVVSRYQHLRYLADIDVINDFNPKKHGFETVERKFVPLSELKNKAQTLQNPNGEILIQQVEEMLRVN